MARGGRESPRGVNAPSPPAICIDVKTRELREERFVSLSKDWGHESIAKPVGLGVRDRRFVERVGGGADVILAEEFRRDVERDICVRTSTVNVASRVRGDNWPEVPKRGRCPKESGEGETFRLSPGFAGYCPQLYVSVPAL